MKIKKSAIFLLIVLMIIVVIVVRMVELPPKENKDYGGELAQSKQQQNISITVFATPLLTIISPTNQTYSSSTIQLDYSVTNADAVWYNLNHGANITLTSPIVITVSDGSYTLYLYANNSEGVTEKNITFSVYITPTENGGGDGGGGGGGGGGDGEINGTRNESCQESWVCEPWTECTNLTQQRTCTDTNLCNEPYSRTEKRACTSEGPETPGPGEPRRAYLSYLFWIILLLILAGIIIVVIITRNKIKELIGKIYKHKK